MRQAGGLKLPGEAKTRAPSSPLPDGKTGLAFGRQLDAPRTCAISRRYDLSVKVRQGRHAGKPRASLRTSSEEGLTLTVAFWRTVDVAAITRTTSAFDMYAIKFNIANRRALRPRQLIPATSAMLAQVKDGQEAGVPTPQVLANHHRR